jgi:hypothetical protein
MHRKLSALIGTRGGDHEKVRLPKVKVRAEVWVRGHNVEVESVTRPIALLPLAEGFQGLLI